MDRFTVKKIIWRLKRVVCPPADLRAIQRYFIGRSGLEIGGPSHVFTSLNRWPVYRLAARLDNVDYSPTTLWADRQRAHGMCNVYRDRYICEASNLVGLPIEQYDFLIASHVLEHLANPVRALQGWMRVVRPGGLIFLVVPHVERTFDHNRPITALSHLLDDYWVGIDEADGTHFEECLTLFDLTMHPEALDSETFAARTRANFANRSVHHHVFDTELTIRLLDAVGLTIEYVDPQLPYHICVGAQVPASPGDPGVARPDVRVAKNARYLSLAADWRRKSPFSLDRAVVELRQ